MSSRQGIEVPITVRRVLEDGTSIDIPSGLSYWTADPYAIWMTFYPNGQDAVAWTFARELLAAGMDEPAGIGDVRIWPYRHDTLAMAMSSPEGNSLFHLPRVTVVKFLRQSYTVVPRGREQLDLDSELAELLDGAS